MKKVAFLIVTVALVVLVLIFLSSRQNVRGDEYRSFKSPDGRFKVVVYRNSQLLGSMPGQSGDASGDVCLYSVQSGKMLERKSVEMVQNVDQITWSATNVDIKLFADWKLPK